MPPQHVARSGTSLVSLGADDAVRFLGSKPYRLDDLTAELGYTLAERPLGCRRVVPGTDPAYTRTLLHGVGPGPRLVPLYAEDSVPYSAPEPFGFEDLTTQLTDPLPKRPLSFDRILPGACPAETSPESKAGGARRHLMADLANDAMWRVQSEPLGFDYVATEFGYAITELLPHHVGRPFHRGPDR